MARSQDWALVVEKDVDRLAEIDGLQIDYNTHQLSFQHADTIPPLGILGGIVVSMLVQLARTNSMETSLPQKPLPLRCTTHDLCLVVLATVPSIDLTISFKVLSVSSTHLLVVMSQDFEQDTTQVRFVKLGLSEFLNTEASVINSLSNMHGKLDTTFFKPLSQTLGKSSTLKIDHQLSSEIASRPPHLPSSNHYLRQPPAIDAFSGRPNPYLMPPRPIAFPSVGSSDLFPRSFPDPRPYPPDCMLMGPSHPVFSPHRGGYRGGLGARFDPTHPFSLPDDPAPDHLRPPFSDSPFG